MVTDRPKLPPGYTGPVRCTESMGRASGSVYWAVFCPAGDRVITGGTREMAVERAWAHWLPTGITRERWEAMERDHRVMEAMRSGDVIEVTNCDGYWQAHTHTSQGSDPDPAEAIFAALGYDADDLRTLGEKCAQDETGGAPIAGRAAALDGEGADDV